MKYLCPSCFMEWEDDAKPLEMLSQPLCVFCSSKHSQKELLNWQMNHIEDINKDNQGIVLRHFYRYVENEISLIKESIHGQQKEENGDGGNASS